MQDVLEEVVKTGKILKKSTEDLVEMRELIDQTKSNFEKHIYTVTKLKDDLIILNKKS